MADDDQMALVNSQYQASRPPLFIIPCTDGELQCPRVLPRTALLSSDPSGPCGGSQRFGGPGYDSGYGLALGGKDNVILTSDFANSVSFGGGTLTGSGACSGGCAS